MDSPASRDDNPSAHKKKDSSTDMEDLETTEVEVSMLRSIHNKLELLMELHKQMKEMQLKLPPDTVDNITFHCVHRLGSPKSKKPRPIITKLEHYKHKDLIKSKARELKASNFGINDQFPKEINDRRKILYPIMKQHRQNNKRAYMVVDKLYVDGQLYRSPSTTPWFF
ncbi:hypothetical protein LDENG_00248440 [Lucifuga dentata]|nr:hypothetical protein LDENG_00248440 [Lucifuga dentata]